MSQNDESRRSERPNKGNAPDRLIYTVSGQSSSRNVSQPGHVTENQGEGGGPRRKASSCVSVSSHASVATVTRRRNMAELQLAESVAKMELNEEVQHLELMKIEVKKITTQLKSAEEVRDDIPVIDLEKIERQDSLISSLKTALENLKDEVEVQEIKVSHRFKALEVDKGLLELRIRTGKSKIEEEDLHKSLEQDLTGEESEMEKNNRIQDWNNRSPSGSDTAPLKIQDEDSARAQEVNRCLKEQRVAKEQAEAKQLELEARLKTLMDYPGRTVVATPHPGASIQVPQTVTSTLINPTGTSVPSRQPLPVETNSDSKFDRFMARQSHSKELPFFSGKTEEWLTFLCTYERTTELCGFSDAENLVRLQKCLKGEALRIVQALMISPDNVSSILRALKKRFGRPEHIVEGMILKTRNLALVKEDKPESMIDFGIAVNSLTATIRALKCDNHMSNPTLLRELESKLPINYKVKWAEWRNVSSSRMKDLRHFAEWVDEFTEIMCDLCLPKYSEEKPKGQDFQKGRRRGEVVLAVQDPKPNADRNKEMRKEQNISIDCLYCEKKFHIIEVCHFFLKQNVDARWEAVKKLHVCFLCLKKGHRTDNCRNGPCGVDGCESRHHPALHQPKRQIPLPRVQQPEEKKPEVNTNISQLNQLNKLLRIIPVILRRPKEVIKTYAILDEGSTVTMLQDDVAKKLGLQGKVESFCIQWFNGRDKQEEKSSKVKLEVAGDFYGSKYFKLEGVRTISDLKIPAQTLDVDKVKKQWPHLKRMKLSSMKEAKPTILIGIDNARLTFHKEVLEGPRYAPIATRTRLGWALGGPTDFQQRNTEFTFHICEKVEQDIDLHKLMKDFFSTESFGVKIPEKKLRSKQDKRALAIMESTTKKVGGRWETGLLWKSDDSRLPESKKNAVHRLTCMEKKMDRIPEFGIEYCDKILDYEKKSYIRKLTETEVASGGDRVWYLPHFGVTNVNKPGKLRLVFDAAAKSGGTSLNDTLLTGRDLLRSLPVVLWNFRLKSIAFMANIQEMFHQVKMKKEDTPSLRFLWRGMSRDRPPDTYEMQVMIFGATSSPSSAIYVKDRNALEWCEQYPEAVKAITKDHYMDDYLGNANTVKEGIKLAHEVIKIHNSGGFKIAKWVSNSKEFLEAIPEELRETGLKNFENKTELPVERVLGLWWNAEEDVFTFRTNFQKIDKGILDGSRVPTKREMASLIGQYGGSRVNK